MHHIVLERRVTYNQQSKTYLIYNERQQRKATNPDIWGAGTNKCLTLLLKSFIDYQNYCWFIFSSLANCFSRTYNWEVVQTSETGVGCIKPRLYFALLFFLMRMFYPQAHSDKISVLRLTDHTIISASYDRTVKLWDRNTKKQVHRSIFWHFEKYT